jgi:hypothetical protein
LKGDPGAIQFEVRVVPEALRTIETDKSRGVGFDQNFSKDAGVVFRAVVAVTNLPRHRSDVDLCVFLWTSLEIDNYRLWPASRSVANSICDGQFCRFPINANF